MRPTSVGGGSRRMLPPRQSLVPGAVLEHQTGRAGYASKYSSERERVAFSVAILTMKLEAHGLALRS